MEIIIIYHKYTTYLNFTFKDKKSSNELKQKTVNILDAENCSTYESFDFESQICAGGPNGKNDACQVVNIFNFDNNL